VKAVALLAAALLMAGCSDPAPREPLPDEWRGRDLRQPGWVNETLQPGWTLALEYQWSAGKRVDWDWVVTAPVQARDPVFTAFIHFQLVRFEADGSPRAIVANDAQEGAGERTVTQGGRHQVDWMNEFNRTITLAYQLPAGGTRILYPPGQGPGCLFGFAAMAPMDGCLASLPPLPP
jgi:hypothetical protein